VPKVEKIRGLNLPGTAGATSACRGIPLLLLLVMSLFLINYDSVREEFEKKMADTYAETYSKITECDEGKLSVSTAHPETRTKNARMYKRP
jgi:hypothetical protein